MVSKDRTAPRRSVVEGKEKIEDGLNEKETTILIVKNSGSYIAAWGMSKRKPMPRQKQATRRRTGIEKN